MRPLILFISFLLLSISILGQKRYVILVSMDGFRWDYPSIYNTPQLNEIAREGVKAQSLIPSFPSITFPNHYTIVTGLYPDHHGLVHNNFYDSTLHLSYSISNRQMVEDSRFYGGEPIWNTAEKQGIKTASFFWVGSETLINQSQPTYWKKYDAKVSFESRIDTVIHWLGLPEKDRPHLILLYFSEPDHTGHLFGPYHYNTGKMVGKMDSLIGVLHTKIKQSALAKDVDLIIVSDHGMSTISDTTNIILDHHFPFEWCKQVEGFNPCYMIRPETGYEDSIIYKLRNVSHIQVWKKDEIPLFLNYGKNPRIFPLVILADSGYSLNWSNKKIEKGGAHGYDIRNTDMHGIFYAVGPDFKQNTLLPSFSNIHIYYLLTRLLAIKPSPNDGDERITQPMLKER